MKIEATSTGDWSSEEFRDEARAWVAGAVGPMGVELSGESEQPHLRSWSSAIRFGSSAGDLWFKVNASGTRHEGALLAVLARHEPDLVADLLAVDVDRGWSLTRDAGPVMRVVAEPDELWPHWEALLVRYADAQIRLAGHLDDLLGSGVGVVSATTLPGQFRELVAELGAATPEAGGLTDQERDALEGVTGEYDAWCGALAGSGIPDSIQHDDLHSSNVGWGGSAATSRIIDWGDATVGFPLGTMLATLNSIAWHAKTEVDDPRVVRVRDAYLEPFTTYADRVDLVGHVALARRTGCVTRALSYRTSFQGEPLSTQADEDFPVRGWLLELLEE